MNVTVIENKVFKEVINLRWGSGPNPLGQVTL